MVCDRYLFVPFSCYTRASPYLEGIAACLFVVIFCAVAYTRHKKIPQQYYYENIYLQHRMLCETVTTIVDLVWCCSGLCHAEFDHRQFLLVYVHVFLSYLFYHHNGAAYVGTIARMSLQQILTPLLSCITTNSYAESALGMNSHYHHHDTNDDDFSLDKKIHTYRHILLRIHLHYLSFILHIDYNINNKSYDIIMFFKIYFNINNVQFT